MASALSMSDSDFLAGRMRFTGGGGPVINEGALQGQFIGLIGGTVENRGSILANEVVLAAGSAVVIDRAGKGEIRVMIDGQVAEPREMGEVGSGLSDNVDESGDSFGGEASAGEGASSGATETNNDTAPVDAHVELSAALGQMSQDLTLESSALGTVANQGVIEASGIHGGTVIAQGTQVGQYGTIHADGSVGDGGNIQLVASDAVLLGADSITTANAGLHGAGGQIVVVGDDTAVIEAGARLEARGGSESGDGGFVETSGHRSFLIGSMPDVGASAGRGGTWLIDPTDINIVAGVGGGIINTQVTENTLYSSDISSFLENTGSLTITTDSLDIELGNITWESGADVTWTATHDLSLNADNNIFFNGTIVAANGNVEFNAQEAIELNGNLSTDGGNVDLTAGGALTVAGVVESAGGNIALEGSTIGLGADVNAGAGNVDLTTTAGAIAQTAGTLTGNALTFTSADAVTLGSLAVASAAGTSVGNITLGNTGALDVKGLDSQGGDIDVAAGGMLTVADAVKSSGGDIALEGTTMDLAADVNAGAGDVELTGTTGEIVGSGRVMANRLTADSMSGISLNTTLEELAASVRGTGNIVILQSGGSDLAVSQATTFAGNIEIISMDAGLTIETVRAVGDATLTAAGDLDVDGVVQAQDQITMTAGTGGTGSLRFNSLLAETIQAGAHDDILMGEADADTALFTAGGSVMDNGSMLNVGHISIQAGGDVGSAAMPIGLNVNQIDHIAGNDIYLTQNRGGPLMLDTILANGRLELRVPHGMIWDANDGLMPVLNIAAASVLFDANQVGQQDNPLELEVPGTLTLQNNSGLPYASGYVWANMSNSEAGELAPLDPAHIPGLVILNGQVVAGQEIVPPDVPRKPRRSSHLPSAGSADRAVPDVGDDVMREVFRTEIYFTESPEMKLRLGVFGSPFFYHYLLQIREPVAHGLMDYALYGDAQITAARQLPVSANQTISKRKFKTVGDDI
ncbi:MAG: hypothetical protein GX803_05240 [Lentisphaerae bacterium]|nr:hypothetical protein [Lentisphaerota bacterium]